MDHQPDNKATITAGNVKCPKSNGDRNVGTFVNEDAAISTPSSATKKSVHWNSELVSESPAVASDSPLPSFKDRVSSVLTALGKWGRNVGEATRKAEDLAGNTWQHLKTSSSFADAALGRIAQGTKLLAEGGYEKIFLQTFEIMGEEKLENSFACYLSTSAGPVMGVLYVSTAKLAYCSDNPLSYKSDGKTEWSYYKVIVPLEQVKAVNPSSSGMNPAEKYIQVISGDNYEFWFMGFLNYNGAVECLQQLSFPNYDRASPRSTSTHDRG